MPDNRLAQKKEELTRFKATALYEDLMTSIQLHRRRLVVGLLNAGLRSHDPKVRAIAESVRSDVTFERELKLLEAPDNVKRRLPIEEDEKEFRDYSPLLDVELDLNEEFV